MKHKNKRDLLLLKQINKIKKLIGNLVAHKLHLYIPKNQMNNTKIQLPKWFIKRNKVGKWTNTLTTNETYQSIIKYFKNEQGEGTKRKTVLKKGTVLYHASSQKHLVFNIKRSKSVFFGLDPFIAIFYSLEKWPNLNTKVYLHILELTEDIEYTFIDNREEQDTTYVEERKKTNSNYFYIRHVYEGKHGQNCEKGKMVCVHPQIAIRYYKNSSNNTIKNSSKGDIYLELTFPTHMIHNKLQVVSRHLINKEKVSESLNTPETKINLSHFLVPDTNID